MGNRLFSFRYIGVETRYFYAHDGKIYFRYLTYCLLYQRIFKKLPALAMFKNPYFYVFFRNINYH